MSPAFRQRAALVCLGLAGLGMALSALPHGLAAGPHFLGQLRALGAPPALAGPLAAGWWFGTLMLLMSAALVLGQAWQGLRGRPPQALVLLPLGLAHAGFGAAALALRGSSHYLGFLLTGLLVLAALALQSRGGQSPGSSASR
ncbi:hypothetical protein [Silanimonas lenta]|uniref:hypothetical protein n=1 Tax=Silanimonas lenta TaxID=265429 RepID=UPI000407709B|nr:hypothetical protein [Silanimonas lenta]